MSEHGRVLAVNRVRLGSQLIGAHALGATSLAVDDGSDFDEFGGSLHVGDQTTTWVEAAHNDDDTATLTLSTGLAAAADDGDPVLLWDASRDVQASEVYAEVEIDGEAGGDPMSAIVAHHLIGDLPEGIRSLVGESVRIEEDGDDWVVVDVLGISETSGPKWESNDPHTLTDGTGGSVNEIGAGQFTHPLLHSRIVAAHEFTAYVNGVALGPDRYTLDADAGVVTVTLGGWETTADNFRFHYAYRSGPVEVPRPVTPTVIGSTTWDGDNYLTTPLTSLALPAGTQAGDLVVLAMIASGQQGAASCSDTRMTEALLEYQGAPILYGRWGVWVGYADTLGALTINLQALYAVACMTVYRGVERPLVWDRSLARTVVTATSSSTTDTLPALSGNGSGAVCVLLHADNGSVVFDQDWSKAPAYILDANPHRTYVEVDVAHTAANPVPAQTTPNLETSTIWRSVVIGLDLV